MRTLGAVSIHRRENKIDRVVLFVTAYVIETEVEKISLGATFLRKNRLDIRWRSDECPFDLEYQEKKFLITFACSSPPAP
jgi:hypothetical protein